MNRGAIDQIAACGNGRPRRLLLRLIDSTSSGTPEHVSARR
jgi:hypothetical protein